MTYDLLKLAEECALFFNTNRSESAKRTMRAVATALREAHAEIEQLRAELARLRKAIEKHRDAEGGGIHTYSWYDKELYKALDAIEAATKEESNGNG